MQERAASKIWIQTTLIMASQTKLQLSVLTYENNLYYNLCYP